MFYRRAINTFAFFFVCLAVSNSCNRIPKQHTTNQAPVPHHEGEYQRDAARFGGVDRGYDVQSYSLSFSFDWKALAMNGHVTIGFHDLDTSKPLVLDSFVPVVKDVRWNDQSLSYSIDKSSGTLTVDVTPVGKVARPHLSITYQTFANQHLGDRAMWGRRSSLLARSPMIGDPVQARVLYTMSEPFGVATWMPCHNFPNDRATFAVETSFESDELFIANGEPLPAKAPFNGRAFLRYQSKTSLPTYLMAFALGQLEETTTHTSSGLPIGVVHRKGLPVDAKGILAETERQISLFESLLTPYPFEKYFIVLLPDFPAGGMEHAGITFNEETISSQSTLAEDRDLMAHELAHHWFGDMVTIRTWDDLWIKEGMATLLASEAMRPIEDPNSTGRLFGSTFGVRDGDIAYAPHIPPDQKYTTGPYGRAAWILTQVRSLVGEDLFWRTLRRVLNEHRFGSISTDEFIDFFRPHLGPAATARFEKAIRAKSAPAISMETIPSTYDVMLTLDDLDGAMIAPLTLTRWRPDLASLTLQLLPGQGVRLNEEPTGFWMTDSNDTHPKWESFLNQFGKIKSATWPGDLIHHLVPPTSLPVLRRFPTFSPHIQSQALSLKTPRWNLNPAQFQHFYQTLSSPQARLDAWKTLCILAVTDLHRWRPVIRQLTQKPPVQALSEYVEPLSVCDGVVTDVDLNSILQRMENDRATEVELNWARLFSVSEERLLKAWRQVLLRGTSLRARDLAMNTIHSQFDQLHSAGRIQRIQDWIQLIGEILQTFDIPDILETGIEIAVQLDSRQTLMPLEGVVLRESAREDLRRKSLCTLVAITKAEDEPTDVDWVAIQSRLKAKTIPANLLAIVNDPTLCGND